MPGRGEERVPATLFAGGPAEAAAYGEASRPYGGASTVAEGAAQEPDTQRPELGNPSDERAATPTAGGREGTSLALAALAVETQSEHTFITQFLAHWGGSQPGS